MSASDPILLANPCKQGGALAKHSPRLLKGTYQPRPVKRVEIPKPDGGSENSAYLASSTD